MNLTVTVLDTSGIQSYIFGSNRLRENVGGSYLVGQATEEWVINILAEKFEISNPRKSIKTSGKDAEVVYMGGGNTVLLFKSRAIAIEFTRILSVKILHDAPGINLVAAHSDFNSDEQSLYDVVQSVMTTQLNEQKRSRAPSSPLLGLSVTQDCLSTRLVAVSNSHQHGSPDRYPVSREIAKKLDAVSPTNDDPQNNNANNALKKVIFDSQVPNKWKIPLDFDDFGRSKGDISYIAVVHIDGNSMGKRFQDCGKNAAEYVQAIRTLSDTVKQAGKDSLRELTQELIAAMPTLQKILDIDPETLPFRPLVYGGDDVTFVCDGRLGLSLASRYLELFSQKKASDGELSACAGVCIVKSHYPFARAYELSEQLCASAKKVAKNERTPKDEQGDTRGKTLSAIDWHIATSGLLGTLSEIREREYTSKDKKSLVMRPLLLASDTAASDDWQTWESATHLFKKFKAPAWQSKRNKIAGLREVLRIGRENTQEFLTTYQLEQLPDLPATVSHTISDDLTKRGWHNEVCGYFDIIEALDFYTPIGGNS